jgi:zinc protease
MLANRTVTPEYAFIEALASILSQNHPRARLPSAASVDQWNLDKSMAFYKDRFADASDFTFVFVGNLDPATMKPFVERYIATLPSLHRKETWKDVGVRTPTGTIVKKVEKGIEPKSLVALVFTGPFQYDQTHRVAIRAMAEVLQTRLLETIREELGGTYSITARQSYRKIPNPEYSIAINFGCDPSRADALVARVQQEVDAFRKNGPTPKQVDDEKQALLREFETNSQQNGYLLNQIALKYQYGEDPATLWAVPEFYRKLDAAAIQQAATLYLSGANRIQVTLVPEGKSDR